MLPLPDPPPPEWDVFNGSATEFNDAQSAANSYGYDAGNMAIKDSVGTPNYLYFGVCQKSSGHIAWYFRNSGNVGAQRPSARSPR